jgi:hypothetical protein
LYNLCFLLLIIKSFINFCSSNKNLDTGIYYFMKIFLLRIKVTATYNSEFKCEKLSLEIANIACLRLSGSWWLFVISVAMQYLHPFWFQHIPALQTSVLLELS